VRSGANPTLRHAFKWRSNGSTHHTKQGASMRQLSDAELQAVAGGEVSGGSEGDALAATLVFMALCPTPLVLGVGAIAVLYYAWC
jgi:hypothetical protein